MADKEIVLVVDDETEVAALLVEQLDGVAGLAAEAAHSGKEALERLDASKDVRIICTDVRMPGMTGIDLLERVRRAEAGEARMPLVLMTGGFASLDMRELYGRGADAIFLKPVELDELSAAVTRLKQPVPERWRGAGASKAGVRRILSMRFPTLEGATNVKLGWSGIYLAGETCVANVGERVRVDVTFERGPVPALRGDGVVRWTGQRASDAAFELGIEMLSADLDVAAAVAKWLNEKGSVAAIPAR